MIFRRPKAPLAVGILIVIGLVAYVTVYRSSPGDLSRAHAAVAGSPLITDCNKCHGEKDVTPGCLACHTEIQSQLKQNKGLHPFLLKGQSPTCAGCHSEHNGPQFDLINAVSWKNQDPKTFKHPHVTFQLTGAHLKLTCEQCHASSKRPPFVLPQFHKNPRSKTYLGLSQSCTSCHADPHAGGRITNCTSCHSQERWKPAPNFNHERFFSLKGVHARVACNQCHAVDRKQPMSSDAVKVFGPVRGKRCADCHKNPHRVEWNRSCESCHSNIQPWVAARHKMTPEIHALTGFKLKIPHQRVTCVQCHGEKGSFAQRYPQPARQANRCESCHQDVHKGQFVARHPHCTDCHSNSTFKPSLWTAKDHTTYPLIGGHATASCNACHTKDPKTGVRRFVGTPKDCASCHRDIHFGQFRDNGRTRCESCHRSVQSWKTLVFNHNTQSQFKLDQAHANVSCKECHPVVSLRNGSRAVQFKPIRHECRDCHDFERQN